MAKPQEGSKINGRKIEWIRTHISTEIGVKPSNSFKVGHEGVQEIEMYPMGVYMRGCYKGGSLNTVVQEQEHFIPWTNIQCCKLATSKEEEKHAVA